VNLQNQVCVITGAARGIGLALAQMLSTKEHVLCWRMSMKPR